MNASVWVLLAERLQWSGACFTGDSLKLISEERLAALERARVLLPGQPRETLGPCPCCGDDCVRRVARLGGKVYAVCPRAQWNHEELSEDWLRVFKVNDAELFRRFGEANDMKGEAKELDRTMVVFGERECGGVKMPVVLVRDLRRGGVLVLRGMMRMTFGERAVAILFPVEPRLSDGDRALLAGDGHRVTVLSEALGKVDRLRIEWPRVGARGSHAAATAAARLVVRVVSKTAMLDGRELSLRPRWFEVLLYLAARVSPEFLPVPTAMIFHDVWADENMDDVEFYESQVDEHISRVRGAIRKAIGVSAAEARRLVFNAKGKGYGLAMRPEEVRVE